MEAVKWRTDYLIKAHSEPFVLYGVVRTAAEERVDRSLQVSDGNTDHFRWQRPEDMTTSRLAYRIDVNHPWCSGTQTQLIPISFSATRNRFQYRGKYDGSITVARRYYRSYSGYGVFFSLLPLTVSNTYMYHSIIAHTLCLAVSPTTREGSSTCASAGEVPWQGSTQRSEDHRRPIVPAAVEQHAVRHQSRLPTHHLLRLYYISRKKRSLCRWNRIAC
ncbi:hypothetical protein B296_00042263 [Ensete ventricosum]|uniref:cellulase n=1 Tax=Ensete ventricosum TaxID=4639 RepID=A0A426Y7U9_ENSVE|nr:hypothetical protein B296_00042263 [Ensete ventricosum]